MIAFTQQLAIRNAEYGIRANAILPGLMATPMAVDVRARTINRPREEIMRERDARVPLRGRQGTAWDVANAACSSRPTKPISSPACRCQWMAASWWTSPLAGATRTVTPG